MTMICENCGERLEGKVSKLMKHKCKPTLRKRIRKFINKEVVDDRV